MILPTKVLIMDLAFLVLTMLMIFVLSHKQAPCRCQLVVRFDLPQKALEHIQSRGRARAVGSRLLLMLEAGNSKDLARLADFRG